MRLSACAWAWAALVLAAAQLGASAAGADPIRLVVLGDSLSSGFLIGEPVAFPAVLEASLRAGGIDATVANAGVASDTSADGLARLDRDVPPGTDGVIVELGANDQLRRTAPEALASALDQIVSRLRSRGVGVLLAGFHRPGMPAGNAYDRVYATLAARHRVILHPDIYAGLSTDRRLTAFDGAHPSPEGVRRMVAGILPAVVRFTRTLRPATRSSGRAGPAGP